MSKTEPPCIKGWQLSIKALLCLWDDVKSDSHVKYLCARKVSQDCLENFFSEIRSKGGFCDNPLTVRFIASYKQSLIKSCFALSEFSNCEKDVNSTLFDFFVEKNVSVFHSPGSDCVDLENDIFLPGSERFNTVVSEAVSDDNALYYVCGYLCKKFLSRHNCAECTALLKSTKNMSSLSGSNATFTRFKAKL